MLTLDDPVLPLGLARNEEHSLAPCVINPTFDERYRAWAEAEARIVQATARGAIHDADRLSVLCADASQKHQLLWADANDGQDSRMPLISGTERVTGAVAVEDDRPMDSEMHIVEETAMYTTDTSLHDLRDQVLADLRRDRSRTRWISLAALAAGVGAVALYLSVF